MKGPCVIAWLFSSLGWWRLAQPETDASQCQRAEHPVISYKGKGQACSDCKATIQMHIPYSLIEDNSGYYSIILRLQIGAKIQNPSSQEFHIQKLIIRRSPRWELSQVENPITEATFRGCNPPGLEPGGKNVTHRKNTNTK